MKRDKKINLPLFKTPTHVATEISEEKYVFFSVMDHIFVSPPLPHPNSALKSNTQCDGLGKWGLWEGIRSRGWSLPEWD